MKLPASQGYVLYQLPSENTIYLRIGDWEIFENQTCGFIVQSFDNSTSLLLESEKRTVDFSLSIAYPTTENKSSNLSKEEYIDQVNLFISACNEQLDKVISSRIINYDTKKAIDLFELFKNLANQHQNALVYLYNIPTLGMWMGATPETLIFADQNVTSTMALAGSLPITKETIVWEEKEIQEHQFVIDDISEKLKNTNFLHQIATTETIKAGEVAHLRTLIQIEANSKDTKTLADILHPTSAICGMPQESAKEFILKNEPYDRSFYTGYLGELALEKPSWLFVNLRCMQVYAKSFVFYVGGGITKDSIAEKEWQETELKSRTLLSAIEKM